MAEKPKMANSEAEKELDKAAKQIDAFEDNLKSMTQDRMNLAPLKETEPQTQIAQRDKDKLKEIYLKPNRSIGSREKFNETYREEYNFQKEYVHFTAENKEIIGESITLWTKPFAGMPAEEWIVPVNKPLWGPRYLAERLAGCKYHRFIMAQNVATGTDGMGQYYGTMAVDTIIQRLDAKPESARRSVFMGGSGF